MPAPRIDNLNNYTNLLINSAFDFWQRNTTFAGVAAGAYTADRWQYNKGGAVVHTVSRSTDVPTVVQSGFQSQFSLLATVTTNVPSPSGSDFAIIQYNMEGQDYAGIHAQPVRLQFWVKSSVTGTGSVAFRNNATNRTYIATYTVSAANTWERKTIDLTMDSSGTWLFDNGRGLAIGFTLMAAATFQTGTIGSWQAGNFLAANSQTNFVATNSSTFQLAQVMLVRGSFPSSATSLSFQRAGRTIGDELRMCQRYYEAWTTGTSPQNIFIIYGIGGGNALSTTYQFHTQKRATPNVTISNVTYTNSAFSLSNSGASNFSLQITSSAAALAQGNVAANTTWMTADAELT